MDTWLHHGLDLLNRLLRQPSSSLEAGALVAAFLLVATIAYRWSGRAAGMTDTGLPRRILGLWITYVLMFASAIAVSIYVAPNLDRPQAATVLLLGAPALTALVLGLPLQRLFIRCRFWPALVALISSLVVGVLATLVVSMLIHTVQTGKRQSSKLREGQEQVEEVLK